MLTEQLLELLLHMLQLLDPESQLALLLELLLKLKIPMHLLLLLLLLDLLEDLRIHISKPLLQLLLETTDACGMVEE